MKGISLLASLILVFSVPSYGAELVWKQRLYSHFADGEPLEAVLKDLMSGENIPVMFSDKIDANVFMHLEQMPPDKVLNHLAKMYQFIWYFDGHSLFVYDMSELTTATLKLNHLPTHTFTGMVNDMGLSDERYHWETSEERGLIYFSGPERMVNLIMEMAKAYDTETPSNDSNVVYKWMDKKGTPNFATHPPADKTQHYKVISLLTGEVVRESRSRDKEIQSQ